MAHDVGRALRGRALATLAATFRGAHYTLAVELSSDGGLTCSLQRPLATGPWVAQALTLSRADLDDVLGAAAEGATAQERAQQLLGIVVLADLGSQVPLLQLVPPPSLTGLDEGDESALADLDEADDGVEDKNIGVDAATLPPPLEKRLEPPRLSTPVVEQLLTSSPLPASSPPSSAPSSPSHRRLKAALALQQSPLRASLSKVSLHDLSAADGGGAGASGGGSGFGVAAGLSLDGDLTPLSSQRERERASERALPLPQQQELLQQHAAQAQWGRRLSYETLETAAAASAAAASRAELVAAAQAQLEALAPPGPRLSVTAMPAAPPGYAAQPAPRRRSSLTAPMPLVVQSAPAPSSALAPAPSAAPSAASATVGLSAGSAPMALLAAIAAGAAPSGVISPGQGGYVPPRSLLRLADSHAAYDRAMAAAVAATALSAPAFVPASSPSLSPSLASPTMPGPAAAPVPTPSPPQRGLGASLPPLQSPLDSATRSEAEAFASGPASSLLSAAELRFVAEARRLLAPSAAPELLRLLTGDAITLMALGRTGVDAAQLQPRGAEHFRRTVADAPALLRDRKARYDALRSVQMAMVLADRDGAALALAGELDEFVAAQRATQRAVAERAAAHGLRAVRAQRQAGRLREARLREGLAQERLREQAADKVALSEARAEHMERERRARNDARKERGRQRTDRLEQSAAAQMRVHLARSEQQHVQLQLSRPLSDTALHLGARALSFASLSLSSEGVDVGDPDCADCAGSVSGGGGGGASGSSSVFRGTSASFTAESRSDKVRAMDAADRARREAAAEADEERSAAAKAALAAQLAKRRHNAEEREHLRRENAARVQREASFKLAAHESRLARTQAKAATLADAEALLLRHRQEAIKRERIEADRWRALRESGADATALAAFVEHTAAVAEAEADAGGSLPEQHVKAPSRMAAAGLRALQQPLESLEQRALELLASAEAVLATLPAEACEAFFMQRQRSFSLAGSRSAAGAAGMAAAEATPAARLSASEQYQRKLGEAADFARRRAAEMRRSREKDDSEGLRGDSG